MLQKHHHRLTIILTGTHLVEVENQIQLTDIPEELVQHLDEEMDGFQVRQLVVIGVDADTEEQPRVSAVDDLGAAAELDEIGLVFLVSGCDEAMDLGSLAGCCRWESRGVTGDEPRPSVSLSPHPSTN